MDFGLNLNLYLPIKIKTPRQLLVLAPQCTSTTTQPISTGHFLTSTFCKICHGSTLTAYLTENLSFEEAENLLGYLN